MSNYNQLYSKDEKLILDEQVGITKKVYKILRKQKRKQKMSMAKITCNLILEKYGEEN